MKKSDAAGIGYWLLADHERPTTEEAEKIINEIERLNRECWASPKRENDENNES